MLFRHYIYFCFLILGTEIVNANPLTNVEIKKIYGSSIVSIIVEFESEGGEEGCKHGSGVIVTSNGNVVTSKHLFLDKDGKKFKKINIKGVVGEPLDCADPVGFIRRLEFLKTVQDVDAALLQIVSKDNFEFVQVCRENQILDGDDIFVLGFPLAQPLSAKTGQIDSLHGPEGSTRLAIEINEGNSGGPVFNKFGRLIGIIQGDLPGFNDFTFMVPVHLFKELIEVQGAIVDCETLTGAQTEEESCVPIFVSHVIDWTNNDHKSFGDNTQLYNQSFSSEAGYFIATYKWIARSVNNASGPLVDINDSRDGIKVQAKITAGPIFDRWRGWMNGLVETTQLPLGCDIHTRGITKQPQQ